MAAPDTLTMMVKRSVGVFHDQSGVILFVQANLVCGGYDGSLNTLVSCEENIAGTRHWTYTTSLPRPLSLLRGVTLDNRPLMTGE